MTASVTVGDLVCVRDDQGFLHLAHAFMDYDFTEYVEKPQSAESAIANKGFHVAYLSDHSGISISRNEANLAVEDLRRSTWYLAPVREWLVANMKRFTESTRAAVSDALKRLDTTDYLTCEAGKLCPRSGRWILRGTNYSIEINAGEVVPHYRFFAGFPPQWCRWDLPGR